jgi:MFS family permease
VFLISTSIFLLSFSLSLGRLSDYTARLFGIGGRLLSVVFTLFFISIPIILFCFFLERNLVATLIMLYFCGFCLSFPRSGALTFAIEKCPSSAAGVACSFTSLQFILAFFSVSAAAYIYEHFGLLYFGFSVTPIYLIYGIANALLAYRYIVSFEVIEVTETEDKEEPAPSNDIELKDISTSPS